MKRFRSLAVVLTLALAMGTLAGCGSKEEETTTETTTETTETTTDETATKEPGSTEPTMFAAEGYPEPREIVSDGSDYTGGQYTMKVGFGLATEARLGWSLMSMKEAIETRSAGNITVELYGDGQLGSEREIAESAALGTIQGSITGFGTYASLYSPAQMWNVPFLFDDREHSERFFDESDFMKQFSEDMGAAVGTVVLGYSENGGRCFQVANGGKEFRLPSDLAGMKIRVQENPIHMAMVEGFGATPTPISFTELYTALQQGTVDGNDNPLTTGNEKKYYEVQDSYTLTNHVWDQLVFAANAAWVNSLDDQAKEIVLDEGAQSCLYERALSEYQEGQELQLLKDKGITVVEELTDEELQAWKDACAGAYDAGRELVGDEFFDSALEAIDACR